jgi:hypothetical protein
MLGTMIVKEDKQLAEILAIIRAMYEAILIVSFFQLIVAYVCYNKDEGVNIENYYELMV